MGNSAAKRHSTVKKSVEFNYQTISKYIDLNSAQFIKHLSDAVSHKSVSSQPEHRDSTIEMVKWMEAQLKEQLSFDTTLVDIGQQVLADGSVIPYPPVLLAELGSNPTKRTLLIYGHLDVQPVDHQDEQWKTDPWILMERDDKLYGRGTTDDKGPVLGWVHAIQAYQANGMEVPVNVKFILEATEESGSVGLDRVIQERKDTFFANVDFICISDSYWLGTKKPCLTYGLRGIAYFNVEIESANQDLHSGTFGGSVYECMTDLIALMSRLVDNRGRILVPDFLVDVPPMSKEEEKLYEGIDFAPKDLKHQIGAKELVYNSDKLATLAHRWRYPSLSIHGIEGGFSGPGIKSVIPHRVVGKFSIRLVPNQDPEKIKKLVTSYLIEEYVKLNNPNNKLNITMEASAKPWITNPNDLSFTAAKKAIKLVYGIEPDLIREGGSLPVTRIFTEILGDDKSILLLPMGGGDDGPHGPNEKIDKRNYLEGTKVAATFLYKLGKLGAKMDHNNNANE